MDSAPQIYRFSIGGRVLALEPPGEMTITEEFSPFFLKEGKADVTVTFRKTDELPAVSGSPVYKDVSVAVYPWQDGFARLHHEHLENDCPYAVTQLELHHGRVAVEYLAGHEHCFTQTRNTFSHVSFEELLLNWNRLILHASFVAAPQGGLLFSGPSGIGKSTQAELWRRCGSTVINGDRPILGLQDGRWLAYGSPFAGSSRCYRNQSEPVRGIFLLEQGEVCSLRRLGTAEAFRGLYSGIIVNSWNSRFVTKACDLLAELAAAVPVYRFICTPDQAAVEAVRRVLEEGGS